MNKETFIKTIKEGTNDSQLQIDCITFFLANYPVLARAGFNKQWTKIILDVPIVNDGSPLIWIAFDRLRDRLDELS